MTDPDFYDKLIRLGDNLAIELMRSGQPRSLSILSSSGYRMHSAPLGTELWMYGEPLQALVDDLYTVKPSVHLGEILQVWREAGQFIMMGMPDQAITMLTAVYPEFLFSGLLYEALFQYLWLTSRNFRALTLVVSQGFTMLVDGGECLAEITARGLRVGGAFWRWPARRPLNFCQIEKRPMTNDVHLAPRLAGMTLLVQKALPHLDTHVRMLARITSTAGMEASEILTHRFDIHIEPRLEASVWDRIRQVVRLRPANSSTLVIRTLARDHKAMSRFRAFVSLAELKALDDESVGESRIRTLLTCIDRAEAAHAT